MDINVKKEIDVPFADPNLPKPKAIMLYASQWEVLQVLSAQELGWLFEAVFRTLSGEDQEQVEKTLSPKVLMGFRFIIMQVKIDTQKYQQAAQSRKDRNARYYEKKKGKK